MHGIYVCMFQVSKRGFIIFTLPYLCVTGWKLGRLNLGRYSDRSGRGDVRAFKVGEIDRETE
jgi:hypothetical protein